MVEIQTEDLPILSKLQREWISAVRQHRSVRSLQEIRAL